MTGGDKPGDAKADLTRDLFKRNDNALDNSITKLEIRAEVVESKRPSMTEEEVSAVITQQALEAQRKKAESEHPSKASPAVIVLTVVRKFPAWGSVLVALAAIAAYVALQLVK